MIDSVAIGYVPISNIIFMILRDCVETILAHKCWKRAMRTSHPIADSFGEIVIETPMRYVLI